MFKGSKFMECLRKTFPFVKPYLLENILSLITSLISSVLLLLTPYMIKILIDDILIREQWGMLRKFGLIFFILVLAGNLFRYLAGYFYVTFSEKIVIDAREYLFSHLIHCKLEFFKDKQVGDLVNRLRDDATAVHSLFSFVLANMIRYVFTIIFIFIVLMRMNATLAIMILINVPVYVWINNYYGKILRKNTHRRRSELSVLMTFIYDAFSKIVIIKNFCYENCQVKRITDISTELKKFIVKGELSTYKASAVTQVTSQMMSALILIIGSIYVRNGSLTAGGLMAFYAYLNNLLSPVLALNREFVQANQVIANTERFFELLGQSSIEPQERVGKICPQIQGRVQFEGVHFGYESEMILDDLSFEIHPKEKVAILGRSGIGKTTMALLLKRFYEPLQGTIRLDGIDINQIQLTHLRQQVGYLPQEPLILEGTVRENVTVGKPDAQEEEIWAALKLVHADQLIKQLPDGLDTLLGNNGAQLSGGQKQRLSMARIIIQNPPIVVFDEVFSHLDVETENFIWRNFKNWLVDKTVISITHELAEPEYFDKLIILNKKIEAMGSYQEIAYHPFLQEIVNYVEVS